MKEYEIQYSIGCYSGTVTVSCDENDENDVIIAKAKNILRKKTGPLPFGSESFRIEEGEDEQ